MSRKITQESVRNFLDGVPFKKSNMSVVREGTIYYLKLHGNKIAALESDGRMWVSSAGWHTNTTKERLNGLPGVRVNQKNWDWYLNGQLWDGSPQYVKQF
jgi:hypothetical protein